MRVVKINVPPDKSISHRAIMLASISQGSTRIENILMGDDCLRTIGAFRAMGVKIDFSSAVFLSKRKDRAVSADILVHGVGMRGLKKPAKPLYLGNSGTTMRILPGILAGQGFGVILKGDRYLSKRPMLRIIKPLKEMGAQISGSSVSGTRGARTCPPLKIRGGQLKAIKYLSGIASAQVKSCVLMAGLFADGTTGVTEPVKSRDHTERMLRQFGAVCRTSGRRTQVSGPARLGSPGLIRIPADISSAAFFIVAGSILPDTKIILKDVGLNPTRMGIVGVLKRMGADIKIRPLEADPFRRKIQNFEPRGDIIARSSKLKGVMVSSEEVVRGIDEIPVIMVASCFAEGTTVIRGVSELRVKETDRVKSMITNLRRMGADIKSSRGAGTKRETVVINGGRPLHGARVSSFGDHRTAMSMLVASLGVKGKTSLSGSSCITKSFPGFENLLRKIA